MKKLVNKKLARKILQEETVEFPSAVYTYDLDLEKEEIVFVCNPTDGKASHEERYPIADFSEFEILKESSDVRTEEETEVINLPFEPVEIDKDVQAELITQEIKNAIDDTKRNFVLIAKNLYEIKELIHKHHIITCELPYEKGCHISCGSIYEYGKKVFGFTKSTVSDFVNIAERFLIFVEESPTVTMKWGYDNYSSSQLQALLPIKDNEWINTHCSPSMTVREIKELSRQWKNRKEMQENPSMEINEEENEEVSEQDNKQDSKQNENDSVQNDKVLGTLKEYRFFTFEDYNKALDKMDEKISKLLKSGKSLVISIKEV